MPGTPDTKDKLIDMVIFHLSRNLRRMGYPKDIREDFIQRQTDRMLDMDTRTIATLLLRDLPPTAFMHE